MSEPVVDGEPGVSPRPRAATYAGLGLITLATLAYEIALTRIFSVTMWYHFAFLAISIALFGLTAGALIVHLLPSRFAPERVHRQLWVFSLLFAVSVAVSIAIQLSIHVEPHLTTSGILTVVATCFVVAVPFVFSGITVCLALTRFPKRTNRLYAADLVGAGLGCVLLALLFTWLDGPSVVLALSAVAAIGAAIFAVGAGSRRGIAAGVVGALLLGGLAVANHQMLTDGNAPLRIRWAKDAIDEPHKYERWNPFSRITVDGDADVPQRPFGYGFSNTMPEDTTTNQLAMLIDSAAGTILTRYDGDPAETDFLQYDVSNLAHYLRSDARVLVIGVGGGRDILSALEFDQQSVVGVEINANVLDALNGEFGDFTGHLDRRPGVKMVNDEARSYLARNERKYDIIQISLIDTWAATSAGAYALGENSLYTTDAWNLFFDRLKPGGVLSVSRWYEVAGRQPLETYRMTSLAAETLTGRGVSRPRDHMLVYRGTPFEGLGVPVSAATLLVSPQRFTDADIAAMGAATDRLGFLPVLTPTAAVDNRFAALSAPGGPGPALDRFDEDVSAPTDERPFFFQMADLETLLRGDGFEDSLVVRPVLVLGLLGLIVLILAAACIGLPLLLGRRSAAFDRKGLAPYTLFFGGIGFGFLLVEVSQLQRLSIYLGHPIYSLIVVLFTILIFSGVGSMFTEKIVNLARPTSMLVPLGALLAVVVVFGVVTPEIIAGTDDLTTPARILISIALLAPMAVLMGMPFSIGMRAAGAREGTPTAFLWGINGATSVCASVLAIVLSLFFGISVAFLAGAFAYAVALAAMAYIVRRDHRVGPLDPADGAVSGAQLGVGSEPRPEPVRS